MNAVNNWLLKAILQACKLLIPMYIFKFYRLPGLSPHDLSIICLEKNSRDTFKHFCERLCVFCDSIRNTCNAPQKKRRKKKKKIKHGNFFIHRNWTNFIELVAANCKCIVVSFSRKFSSTEGEKNSRGKTKRRQAKRNVRSNVPRRLERETHCEIITNARYMLRRIVTICQFLRVGLLTQQNYHLTGMS